LAQWINTQKSKIAAVAAKFDVDTTGQAGSIFGEQEFPLLHVGADTVGIDAVAFDEGLLDAEGGIDERGKRSDIRTLSESNIQIIQSRM
jgi:hypothetical protein